jgi:hypothetical protein
VLDRGYSVVLGRERTAASSNRKLPRKHCQSKLFDEVLHCQVWVQYLTTAAILVELTGEVVTNFMMRLDV